MNSLYCSLEIRFCQINSRNRGSNQLGKRQFCGFGYFPRKTVLVSRVGTGKLLSEYLIGGSKNLS